MKTIYFIGPHHPIFETMVKYPPHDYKVVSTMTSDYSSGYIKEYYDKRYILIKNLADDFMAYLSLPRLLMLPRQFIADCVFAVNTLPLTFKPSIIGVETVFHFTRRLNLAYKTSFASILLNRLKRCRKIVAISNASKISILNYTTLFNKSLSKILEQKIKVVYPSVNPSYADKLSLFRKTRKNSYFRIVHVNTRPLTRGLIELLKAALMLSSKYDIELRIKLTPRFFTHEAYSITSRFLQKLRDLNVPVTLKIGNLCRDELFKNFYAQGDLFVLPTWMDSFGFVFLEAMSMGLPCIGTDIYAIPELIKNEFNGFIVKLPIKPYINIKRLKYLTTSNLLERYFNLREKFSDEVARQLVVKISKLIEDDKKRRRMGKNSYMLTHSRHFSVKYQQLKLKEIYEEALQK